MESDIIELVDSICRDGADTPISLNKSNGSELPNALSASIHYNTLKVHKVHRHSDSWKIVKLPIVDHSRRRLLSNSVQMAYHKTGISDRPNSFTKTIYTGAYMTLD